MEQERYPTPLTRILVKTGKSLQQRLTKHRSSKVNRRVSKLFMKVQILYEIMSPQAGKHGKKGSATNEEET